MSSDKNTEKINTTFRIAITVGIVLVSLSIFYYFVIFLPQKEETKMKQLKQEQEATQRAKYIDEAFRDVCLEDADKGYLVNWNKECKSRGLKENCSLPLENADRLEVSRQQYKDECFKKYPFK